MCSIKAMRTYGKLQVKSYVNAEEEDGDVCLVLEI